MAIIADHGEMGQPVVRRAGHAGDKQFAVGLHGDAARLFVPAAEIEHDLPALTERRVQLALNAPTGAGGECSCGATHGRRRPAHRRRRGQGRPARLGAAAARSGEHEQAKRQQRPTAPPEITVGMRVDRHVPRSSCDDPSIRDRATGRKDPGAESGVRQLSDWHGGTRPGKRAPGLCQCFTRLDQIRAGLRDRHPMSNYVVTAMGS